MFFLAQLIEIYEVYHASRSTYLDGLLWTRGPHCKYASKKTFQLWLRMLSDSPSMVYNGIPHVFKNIMCSKRRPITSDIRYNAFPKPPCFVDALIIHLQQLSHSISHFPTSPDMSYLPSQISPFDICYIYILHIPCDALWDYYITDS